MGKQQRQHGNNNQQHNKQQQNQKEIKQQDKQIKIAQPAKKSDLLKRTVSGIFMGLIIALSVMFDKVPQLLYCIQILFAIECVYDIYQTCHVKHENIKQKIHFGYQLILILTFLLLSFYFGSPQTKLTSNQSAIIAISIVICLILLCWSFTQENPQNDGKMLVGTLLSCLVIYMTHSGMKLIKSNCIGPMAISTLLVIINDVFAYFVGRLWSKIVKNPHKLIKVSSSKTVAGYIGGFVFTVALSKPVEMLVQLKYKVILTTTKLIIFSVICGLLCPVGGFIGSTLKRSVGIKDFGFIIPGHGGIIDRTDCQWIMYWVMYYILKIKCDWFEKKEEKKD